ncbi:MAG: hypothetical protein K9J12_16335 [Melioribacteraceae bacterium]|nr:hypothetical protein [Melioribacteraceae bacterium]MCF8263979.1 hypothetical protein [Melioribacteraceae bacterium]MCF8413597.1 hypothetical protein [Melioribacteraceae bacterium]MCF8430736.1 hypothetical protein [Melioribacteraceae bacterium]
MVYKFKKIFLAIFVTAILSTCATDETHPQKTHVEADKHKSHNDNNPLVHLKLNHDQKWEMDDHTRRVTTQMKESINSSELNKIEDYRLLGGKLQSQIDMLVQGCTMKGESHNQLHIFLGAYIPTAASLINIKDLEEGALKVSELKSQFAIYDKYFQ